VTPNSRAKPPTISCVKIVKSIFAKVSALIRSAACASEVSAVPIRSIIATVCGVMSFQNRSSLLPMPAASELKLAI
jgi:hypothetical protein